jgi:hypothetical protein
MAKRRLAIKRKPPPRQHGLRVLTASSRRLDLTNRTEARQFRALRQGWQSDAWNYRDTIGELRYAIQFLANSASRMRIFVAAEPAEGESDNPIPLGDVEGVPPEVLEVATEALRDLGRGKLALKNILKGLSTNVSVAGECFLLGQTDPETGEEHWSIRSTDEIVAKDEAWWMREMPDGPQGIIPWVKLDPELTVVSRIWVPHPRFALLADSAVKAMLDDCESLAILRRTIRADGKSRLGRGVLLVPDEASIKAPNDNNTDPEADPVFDAITRALMEPISDEGVASAVAPIAVRAPADALKEFRHLTFAQPFEEQAAKARAELVGIIATSIDLPKEIIMGMADLNHWTSWQVDDNTFRHHIEPHVIELCDGLTGAYLRPYLKAVGLDPEWVRRLVVWYDPTELVTHPDRTADAEKAHGAFVISDEAYRKAAGFTDADKPSPEEIEARQFQHIRTFPPNLLMEFARRMDPTIVVPPITTPGTIPGIRPGGVDAGDPLPVAGAVPIPPGDEPASDEPPVSQKPTVDQPVQGPPPITAAGNRANAQTQRLSRKLVSIDQDLRARLQTAANAAMLRQLERAGAKLRPKVAKDETLRTKIAHRPNERVPAILGESLVAATGLTSADLMGNDDWSGLRAQFYGWTETAQKQALATAIRIGSLAEEDDAVKAAEAAMATGRDLGWEVLTSALTNLGHHLLYNPDPNVGLGDWADLNPDTLVPTGMIRAALGVAGGGDLGIIPGSESTIALGEPIGQIGTGSTITELLESSGNVERDKYEWDHGPSLNPFEPHLDLDGTDFASFDNEALANTTGFPANAYYFPGDHEGCSCDFTPLWVQAETSSANGSEQEES